ncbi:chromosome partitioning protein ParB [Bifidobacterium ramosum]|uniref:Chromosome partitioning protein ParB n=2 Tax=Bifidobacterium ramosum TaxID=1798158 RepID=A0A6L4WWQ2_9BIFI|nr:ParB/RepB/Spo0J family partition protein [Bifidobacterium ramosum]KAB8286594.1 chromosome partitioning protein ParB [Bifidobacterium ramosum]
MAKSRLGKGLGALFPDLPGEPHDEQHDQAKPAPARKTVAGAGVSAPVKTPTEVQHGLHTSRTKSGVKAEAMAAELNLEAKPDFKHVVAKTAKSDSKPSPVAKATESGSGVAEHAAAEVKDTATKGKTAKSKRAAMPGLEAIVHPSDLFFGELDVPETNGVQSIASQPAVAAVPAVPSGEGNTVSSAAGDVSHETSSEDQSDEPELKPVYGGYLAELKVTDIGPNAHQPRTIFDEDELNELAASIKEVGILQPIVVRKRTKAGDVSHETSHTGTDSEHQTAYELIMGERRWRASQLAGLTVIPAIVKTTADDNMLRDALLENLHRVALNPLEEAAAYQQMIDEFGLTQAALSKSVSKSRPQIANTLRLLNLPASVQKKVAAGILSAGHARALLALTDEEEMDKLATRIIAEGLSVRSTEEIVAMKIAQGEQPRKARANKNNPWANSPVQQHLENHFDTKVSIKGSKTHGRIEIVFSSPEDMDRIIGLLMPTADGGESAANDGWK